MQAEPRHGRASRSERGRQVLGLDPVAPASDALPGLKATAKFAELEILHRDRRAVAISAGDAEGLAKVEEHHAIDRRRVQDELDAAIAKVRGKEG